MVGEVASAAPRNTVPDKYCRCNDVAKGLRFEG